MKQWFKISYDVKQNVKIDIETFKKKKNLNCWNPLIIHIHKEKILTNI